MTEKLFDIYKEFLLENKRMAVALKASGASEPQAGRHVRSTRSRRDHVLEPEEIQRFQHYLNRQKKLLSRIGKIQRNKESQPSSE